GDTKKILTALEAVIVTDLKGRIVFINPYTTRLLELPEKDLMMKSSKTMITLINTQTKDPVIDPIPEVVQQMLVVTHEINTALITHNGKQKPVSVTVRPLKDDQNELFGVIVI